MLQIIIEADFRYAVVWFINRQIITDRLEFYCIYFQILNVTKQKARIHDV